MPVKLVKIRLCSNRSTLPEAWHPGQAPLSGRKRTCGIAALSPRTKKTPKTLLHSKVCSPGCGLGSRIHEREASAPSVLVTAPHLFSLQGKASQCCPCDIDTDSQTEFEHI